MQVTKRTFLKGLLATAAAGGVVSQASAKPQADLPAKWDREADVVILGYGGAGASAVITAKDAGADVVIFEKTAQAAGADLWHMNALSCPLGLVVPGLKTALQINMLAPSYIYVDQDGKRFANEKMDNHTCIYGVNVLDPIKHRYPRIPCFVVFDEAARVRGPIIGGATSGYVLNRENYKWSKDNSAEIEKGVIVSAPTIEELAKKINVPAENLVETVNRWNSQINAGADKDFGRPLEKKGKVAFEGREAPVISRPIGDGPYYAAELYPTILNTQGGPRRNKLGQVLDPFGKPIARLYSAGELGSMWGHIYQGATNNSEACVFGRIAGRTVANETPWS